MTNAINKFYNQIIDLDKNLTVLDLACGTGWAGKACLTAGFKSVVFADARPHRLVTPDKPDNWQLMSIDIESDDFVNLIKNFDIILYFGHLYHSIDPENIIRSLALSDCKHLFLESKTLGLADIHEFGPARLIHEFEPSSEDEAAFSEKDELIEICRPSLNWTRQALTNHGFSIDYWCTGSLINDRMTGDNIFGQYLIHATKK